MDLIKITTEEKDLVKNYMNDVMSFDNGIIEIIVGWDLAKERGANILNHKISKNTYWTFSPREKRKIFEEHMKSFVKEGIEEIISDIKINNLNPLKFKTEDNLFFFATENNDTLQQENIPVITVNDWTVQSTTATTWT